MSRHFELIETRARFGEIEAAWRALEARTLPAAVYAGFDWVALSWPHAPATVAAALWKDGRLVAALPLSRQRQATGACQYHTPGGPLIQLASLLIDRDEESDAVITDLLSALATAGNGISLDLVGIPVDSPLGRCAPLSPEAISGRPAQIDLPNGFGPYYAGLSANARSRHQRMLRRMDARARMADSSSWKDDLDWFLATKRNWTPPSGEPLRAWVTSPAAREVLLGIGERWADDRRAILSVLETGRGERAAAKLNFRLGREATFYATTYDPAFAACSPGQVLMLESVRLLAELGVTQLDMMQFPAAYKERFKTSTKVLRRLTIDLQHYSPDGSPWITVPVAATGVTGVATGITGATPSVSLSPAMMRKRSWSLGALWRRMLRSIMKLE